MSWTSIYASLILPTLSNPFLANLLCLGAACILFVLAGSLGKKILDPDIEAAVLGLLAVAYIVFLMGVPGLFSRPWFIALLLCLAAFLIRSLRFHAFDGFARLPRAGKIVLAGLFFLFLYNSFIPDQFYDVLQYHLALPQTYLVNGRYVSVPYNAYSGFPQAAEMLYTLGLGLGKPDNIPLLIQAGILFLTAALLLREGNDPKIGILAAAVWISCPLVIEHARFCKPDVLFSLLVSLAFLWMIKWKEASDARALLFCGIFSGLACSTKLTGFLFAAFILACVLVFSRGARLASAAGFLLPILVLFLPWGIKNWIIFKNPLFPFLQDKFGYFHTYPTATPYFEAFEKGWPAVKHVFTFLFDLTFKGHQYPSMNYIGPAWLLLLPCVIYFAVKERSARLPLVFVAAFYSANAVLNHNFARYFFFPVLPVFALLIGRSIFFLPNPKARKIFLSLACLSIGINLIGWRPLLERIAYGRTALWGMPERKLEKLYSPGHYASAIWVNDNLTRETKVLFLGETRSHLFKKRVIAPSVENTHYLSEKLAACTDAEQLYSSIASDGVTHVLFNEQEFERLKGFPMFSWKEGGGRILRDFWREHLERAQETGPVTIYEIRKKSPKPAEAPPALIAAAGAPK